MTPHLPPGSIVWVVRLAWVLAAILAAAFVSVTMLVWQAPRPPRFPPRETPADRDIPFENLSITTNDGIALKGWWVPAENPASTVILCHGYPGSRSDVLPFIPFLNRAGYNVLAFDFRRLGESAGDRCGIGLDETRDLRAAVDEAERRSTAPIAVMGVSMGAAVSILHAAEDSRVRAVVADSPYAALDEQTRWRVGQAVPWPLKGAMGAWAVWLGGRIAGRPLTDASPVRVVSRIAPRPILFIHCGEDRIVLPEATRLLFKAAGEPKSLWMLPDGGHILAHQRQPEEYVRRVATFIREALGDLGASEPSQAESHR